MKIVPDFYNQTKTLISSPPFCGKVRIAVNVEILSGLPHRLESRKYSGFTILWTLRCPLYHKIISLINI